MNKEVNKILEDLSSDKECLVHNYIINLVNENTNLKQALNEITEYVKGHLEREYFDYDILETNTIYNRDLYKVLQIIDRVLGDDE